MRKAHLTFVCLLLMACNAPLKDEVAETHEIPDNAIRITNYRGHFYFPLSFDSIHGNYVFDTGADRLYHDSSFYASNNFNHTGLLNAVLPGVGHNPQQVKVIADSIYFSLKNRAFATTMTPVFKLKPILGDLADGIIGMSFFKDSILYLNYQKEYMIIYQSLDSVDLTSFSKIQLTKRVNRFYLPMEIKISDSLVIGGDCLLDLGSGSTILTSETARNFNLDERINHKLFFYTSYGGVGGDSSGFDFTADTLKIGDFAFSNIIVCCSNDESGALSSGRRHAGILGSDILERFDLIIDFPQKVLYLKPNSTFNDRFSFSRTGFSYVNRYKTLGCLIVTGLYKESNAEKAGLRIDDEIIEINDVKVDSSILNYGEVLHKSDSLKLGVRDKDEVRIIKFKLNDYDW